METTELFFIEQKNVVAEKELDCEANEFVLTATTKGWKFNETNYKLLRYYVLQKKNGGVKIPIGKEYLELTFAVDGELTYFNCHIAADRFCVENKLYPDYLQNRTNA